ncbi:MAG TPA: hypothetical protein VND62_06710 [Acidimicrobiales bacterium]|nr:hypothetical protein [Acidimicrobiales bacterium]
MPVRKFTLIAFAVPEPGHRRTGTAPHRSRHGGSPAGHERVASARRRRPLTRVEGFDVGRDLVGIDRPVQILTPEGERTRTDCPAGLGPDRRRRMLTDMGVSPAGSTPSS